jgi:Phosphotransferase enzyme family
VTVATDPRSHPEHGWVAAVLPGGARRIRVVGDEALAAALAATGADVSGHDPEVAIGPADRIVGAAPVALVPVASVRPLHGRRVARLARRVGMAAAVWVRAGRARRVLRRRYPRTSIVRWDVEQAVQPSDARRPRRVVEHLPRAAVVIGCDAETGPTLFELAVHDASVEIGEELDEPGRPLATGGGTLIVLARSHVLRVAAGPGRRHLVRHHAALDELWARRPPAVVAERLPRTLANADRGLGAWLLEDRLPGMVPATVDGAVVDDCVDFLVALHRCGHGADDGSLIAAADLVNALSGQRRESLPRLAERLEDELAGLPRGFAHGDFWHRNLLVDCGRLVGVVDWEHAGDGRLPALDLLQLIATQPRNGRGVTAAVTGRLLPWARAGGDATLRRYCAPFGLDVTPALVERLVIAFWLDQLARQLEKCGDRGGSPRWTIDNVDPVLAALGMDRV